VSVLLPARRAGPVDHVPDLSQALGDLGALGDDLADDVRAAVAGDVVVALHRESERHFHLQIAAMRARCRNHHWRPIRLLHPERARCLQELRGAPSHDQLSGKGQDQGRAFRGAPIGMDRELGLLLAVPRTAGGRQQLRSVISAQTTGTCGQSRQPVEGR
jgi:hypothetical protein